MNKLIVFARERHPVRSRNGRRTAHWPSSIIDTEMFAPAEVEFAFSPVAYGLSCIRRPPLPMLSAVGLWRMISVGVLMKLFRVSRHDKFQSVLFSVVAGTTGDIVDSAPSIAALFFHLFHYWL